MSGNRRVIVAVSGLDGSGKSSTIATLRAALEAKGSSVRVVHQFDNVIARSARALRARSPRARPPVRSSSENQRDRGSSVHPLRSLVGHCAVVALAARFLVLRVAQRTDVILFDRFLQDDLERVVRARLLSEAAAVRWARVLPRPTLLVVLAPPTDVSFARQVFPDMSEAQYLKKASRMSALWDAAAAGGARVIRIDTSRTGVAEVCSAALGALTEACG